MNHLWPPHKRTESLHISMPKAMYSVFKKPYLKLRLTIQKQNFDCMTRHVPKKCLDASPTYSISIAKDK